MTVRGAGPRRRTQVRAFLIPWSYGVRKDDDERARRTGRLAAVEAAFDPLPVTAETARVWGHLASAVTRRGGNPRRRRIDLAIAATAVVEGVPLLTRDIGDLRIIDDLVDARTP